MGRLTAANIGLAVALAALAGWNMAQEDWGLMVVDLGVVTLNLVAVWRASRCPTSGDPGSRG